MSREVRRRWHPAPGSGRTAQIQESSSIGGKAHGLWRLNLESRFLPAARVPAGEHLDAFAVVDDAEVDVVTNALEEHATPARHVSGVLAYVGGLVLEEVDELCKLFIERARCLVAVLEPPGACSLDLSCGPAREFDDRNQALPRRRSSRNACASTTSPRSHSASRSRSSFRSSSVTSKPRMSSRARFARGRSPSGRSSTNAWTESLVAIDRTVAPVVPAGRSGPALPETSSVERHGIGRE